MFINDFWIVTFDFLLTFSFSCTLLCASSYTVYVSKIHAKKQLRLDEFSIDFSQSQEIPN
jgi:hypothetical protein